MTGNPIQLRFHVFRCGVLGQHSESVPRLPNRLLQLPALRSITLSAPRLLRSPLPRLANGARRRS